MVSALISVADTSPTQPTPPDTCIKTWWPVNHMNHKTRRTSKQRGKPNCLEQLGVQGWRIPFCPFAENNNAQCFAARENNNATSRHNKDGQWWETLRNENMKTVDRELRKQSK